MTQMLYRPQTKDKKSDGCIIHKLVFTGIPCDAIIVEKESVQEYLSKGWFAHPNDMLAETDEERERELREALEAAGVKVDGRWSLETLEEKMAEHDNSGGSD